MTRSPITTHVLDTSIGKPASGVSVSLEYKENGNWQQLSTDTTDSDGRASNLLPPGSALRSGVYRLIFDTSKYFSQSNAQIFYPEVPIIFSVANTDQHYHVPLLLNPFGYSTYRGS